MAINPTQIQGTGAPVVNRAVQAPPVAVPNQAGTPAIGELKTKQASAQLADGWQNAAQVNPVNNVQTEKTGGLDPSKLLSELKPEELAKLGGDTAALQRLANTSPSPTVSQVAPLLSRPEALTNIAEVMEARPDLQWGDFVRRDQDGNIQVDPSMFDEKSRGLMKDRGDLKPGDLSAMRANFTKWLKNPGLAKEAFDSALDLMKVRTDLRPDGLSQMMGRMITSVGGTGGQQGPKSAAAAVDMFKKASTLMKTRTDLNPENMGRMAEALGKLGGKKDPSAAGQVAKGFERGTQALAARPDMQVDDVINVANTMKKHFPGEDAGSGADRMAAFDKGLNMVQNNPGMDSKGLGTMMDRAAGDGRKGAKLLNAMDTMKSGIDRGTARADVLADPNTRQGKDQPLQEGDIRLDRKGREDTTTRPDRPEVRRQPGQPGEQRGPEQDGKQQVARRQPQPGGAGPGPAGGAPIA